MRIASAAEVEAFLIAAEADQIVPLVPAAPSARSLRHISRDEVVRGTAEYIDQWLGTVNVVEIRDLLKRLDVAVAIIPTPSIFAGYSEASGIIGIHQGLIEFLRYRSALHVVSGFLERLKTLALRSKAVDPAALAQVANKLDKDFENLEAKTFDFILRDSVQVDPFRELLSAEIAARRDIIFNGILIFIILHEFGHSVIEKKPRPDLPPRFDENLDFPINENVRLKQYEEHIADSLACQIVPSYSVPWLVSAATVLFGIYIVLEDLCYEIQEDHPRAANRIALLLHYTDIPESSKEECRRMAELGRTLALKRLQMGRENEPLADRRKRTERYVEARNHKIDLRSLIAVLSAVPSLEAEAEAQTQELSTSEKVTN